MAPLVTGLHMTVCSFELAIYYAHQQCPLCSHSGVEECVVQGIPLIWNQGNLSVAKQILEPHRFLDPAIVLAEKVHATSIILLLGVGSFICYKIFHHFRHKLNKRQKFDSRLLKKLELSQWLSNELITKDISPDVDCIEEKYFGPDNLGDSDNYSRNSDFPQFSDTEDYASTWEDKESPSSSQYLSDSEGIMGTSASNHSIPVFYNKASGVFFNNLPRSSHHEDVCCIQSVEKPMLDPCSNAPLPFHSTTIDSLKPRRSPRRNIHSVNPQNDLNMPRCNIPPDKSLDFLFDSSYDDRLSSEDNVLHEASSQALWDFQLQDQDNVSLSCDLFHEDSTRSQDTASLKAAFSPESLKERYFKAQPFFLCLEKSSDVLQNKHLGTENSLDLDMSPEYSQHIKRENSSNDSLSSFSDNLFIRSLQTKKLVQYDCSDSETCDSCLDLQSEVADLNCHTVDQIEQLENQLHEVKQAVLEIDAGIVELKVYETPPKNSWNISAISPSDVEHVSWAGNGKNDVADIIQHQKMNICCKQLINTIFCSKNEGIANPKSQVTSNPKCMLTDFSDLTSLPSPPIEQLKEVPLGKPATPFCASNSVFNKSLSGKQNYEVPDSGSDFGTDFEEISENEEPCSLEWDPTCLPECSSRSEEISINEAEHLNERIGNNEESPYTVRVPKRKRSLSFPSLLLKQQIPNTASTNLFQRRMTIPIYNSGMRTNAEPCLELSALYRFSEINNSSAICARLPVLNSNPCISHCSNSQMGAVWDEKEQYLDNQKIVAPQKLKEENKNSVNVESCDYVDASHICQSCTADDNGNCLEVNRTVEKNTDSDLFSHIGNDILDNEADSIDNSLTASESRKYSYTDSQIKSVKRKFNN